MLLLLLLLLLLSTFYSSVSSYFLIFICLILLFVVVGCFRFVVVVAHMFYSVSETGIAILSDHPFIVVVGLLVVLVCIY